MAEEVEKKVNYMTMKQKGIEKGSLRKKSYYCPEMTKILKRHFNRLPLWTNLMIGDSKDIID